jgi:hypothetical protein
MQLDKRQHYIHSIWPKVILTVGIAATLICLIVFSLYDFRSSSITHHARIINLRLKQKERRMASLNEMFRLDALMAAETGDTSWVNSYLIHKHEFDKLNDELYKAEPDININNYKEVRFQFACEDSALKYVQQGRLNEAKRILYDKGYQQVNNLVTQKLLKLQQTFEERDEKYTAYPGRAMPTGCIFSGLLL